VYLASPSFPVQNILEALKRLLKIMLPLRNGVKHAGGLLERRSVSGKNHGPDAFFNLLNVGQGNMFSRERTLGPASR